MVRNGAARVACPQVGREVKQPGRECTCVRTRRKKLLEEGLVMLASRAAALMASWRGTW